MAGSTGAVTTDLLLSSSAGDRSSFDLLYEHLYCELHDAARAQLRRYHGDTLDATALVHEAWLRIVDVQDVPWECRAHFLAIAARAMRRAVVDHIRARTALKRGGGHRAITLVHDVAAFDGDPVTLIAIDDALAMLGEFDDRLQRVAECRLFGGMSESETATALDVSLRTVQRDWQRARAWLQEALRE